MATFRGFLGNVVSGLVESALANGTESSPTSSANIYNVKEIPRRQVTDVSHYPVVQREGSLIFYGEVDPKHCPTKYNIILYDPTTPDKMFSLYRTNSQEQAQDAFILLKESLPVLVKVDPVVI